MQGTIVSGARRLSHVDLIGRAAPAARGFDALDIAENDAIALTLRNNFAFFEAAFGAAHLGAYAVPVNWHFTAEAPTGGIEFCSAERDGKGERLRRRRLTIGYMNTPSGNG